MITQWESSKQKLLRSMKIPAQKKLEWLREMNEFSDKYTPVKAKKIRRILRNARSLGRTK